MKNALVLSILATVMFLSGCATRTRYVVVAPGQRVPQDVSDKNAAIAAARQADREASLVNDQEKWKKKLGLFCPIGGYSEVMIHPRLGTESRWLPPSPAKSFLRRIMYVLRTVNTEDGAVEIEDGEGVVVWNMCAKGSITLVKTLEGSELPLLGIQTSASSYQAEFGWSAGGVTNRNLLGRVHSPRGVLYTNSYQQRQDATWSIRLATDNGRFF